MYVYEAIVESDTCGKYSVDFPDFEGCYTWGEDFEEALTNAAQLLRSRVEEGLIEGNLPTPQFGHSAERVISLAVSIGDPVAPEDETWYTTQGAAESLGVNQSRVRQLILDGKLASQKRGRDLWVSGSSLLAWSQNRPPLGRPRKDAPKLAAPV